MKIDRIEAARLTTRQRPGLLIITIYIVFFVFFITKMVFYTEYVGGFPDERAHVSYIAYLQSTDRLIPEFKDMLTLQPTGKKIQTSKLNALTGYGEVQSFTGASNYLGHPPLYYQILRLSGGVTVHGDEVTVDILRLRVMSMAIAAFALMLIFYIGLSRIKGGAAFHLLYAAICTTVPMLAYDCAGVNNDTLAMLGVAVFLLGLLRFAEKRRNVPTYLLISMGVAGSLLSKLTAGLIVLAALLLTAIFTAAREKNLKFLLNRNFLISLPFYLVAAAYFTAVFIQTGSIQPTLLQLNPAEYYASGFYVKLGDRVILTFIQYAKYYVDFFLGTWVTIISHVGLPKPEPIYSLSKIALLSLWVLPLPLLLLLRRHGRLNPGMRAALAVYIGTLFTALYQFVTEYRQYRDISGYLGGYQSRYYLCAVPVMALGVVYLVQILSKRHSLTIRGEMGHASKRADVNKKDRHREWAVWVVCIAFSGLLIYEDIVYFLIHYHQYLM